MPSLRLILLFLAALAGCDQEILPNDDGGARTDLKCPAAPDMATPAAKCAAAEGLSGDILGNLCLDMDKIDAQGLTALGFDLLAVKTKCAGWTVTGNALQPTGIDS